MRPHKTLLFLISIFVVLAIISFVFPKQGVRIGTNTLIRFSDINSLFTIEKQKYADINEILEYHQSDIVDDISEIVKDTLADDEVLNNDTLDVVESNDSLAVVDTIKTEKKPRKEKKKSVKRALEYPKGNSKVLYPFFKKLSSLKKSKELIRVLHYGDSQIEGDRISSYIRNELQKQFGGSGIGLFAPVLIKGTNISIEHKLTGSWNRHTMHSIKNGTIFHKRLGVLMSFGRFAPEINDGNKMYYGEINLRKSNLSYRRTRKFKKCRVFYGYNKGPFIAELKYKDQTLDAELIPVSYQLQTLSWDIDGALDEITISFKGEDSPDVYAIALDDDRGIAVDNIPLRGSSGIDFTRTDLAFLRAMYQELNVKLIIMEFGVNIVPYLNKNYSYYEKQFYKQLKTLKSLRPDISIIVIGVSDMSRKKDGEYVSYGNIEKIRDAQRNAAFKAGCVFWDMYEAMGGYNSMPAWVNADPPLARTDFTHFTWRGSSVISKMFFEALMNDYKKYKSRKK